MHTVCAGRGLTRVTVSLARQTTEALKMWLYDYMIMPASSVMLVNK